MQPNEIVREVEKLIKRCLFEDGANTDSAVISEGIVRNFGFNPEELNKPDVQAKLEEIIQLLPVQFHTGGGDGWTFLNLPTTADGTQWGDQAHAEELLCLAQALGMAGYCLPRDMWNILPGGVPYVWFKNKDVQNVSHGSDG